MLVERDAMFYPLVGMQSCVYIHAEEYPVRFGNYCTIVGGPYLCNIWAENLVEWARRNVNSGPIKVTVVEHESKSIGFVSDERLSNWCNSEPCVTGNGWPSVAALRLVAHRLDFSLMNRLCGCERDEENPLITQFFKSGEWGYCCNRCSRCWSLT